MRWRNRNDPKRRAPVCNDTAIKPLFRLLGLGVIWLALGWASLHARAQTIYVGLEGDYLGSRQTISITPPNTDTKSDQTTTGHLLRARLVGELDYRSWSLRTWYDHEMVRLRPAAYQSMYTKSQALYAWENDQVHVAGIVSRANLTYHRGMARLRLGRQRVSWGSGFLWSPTDIIHPVDPARLESDEKPARDLVALNVFPTTLSSVDVVWVPSQQGEKGRQLVRLSTNIGLTDLAWVGGNLGGTYVVGGHLSSYVGSSGLRVDAITTLSRNPSTRVVINVDRQLSATSYVLIESFFRLDGTRKSTEAQPRMLPVDQFACASWCLAAALSQQLHPLATASVTVITDEITRSTLLLPTVTLSVANGLGATVGAYFGKGTAESLIPADTHVWFLRLSGALGLSTSP
ncbi:MAG: hypothetical protein EB075_01160 [Bacteroidetes bacterium]|nr:hypothetical protein [Bacteroidota bacterium]